MSAADQPTGGAPDASAIAARCRDAEFVRLVATADGDALAAAGVLADALAVPFQLTVARPGQRADRTTDADLTVAIGGPDVVADIDLPGGTTAASATAFEVGRELAEAPDAVLAMAGVTAAGDTAGTLAEVAGLDREPGVAIPTTDFADGLAHSTLVYGPFSGSLDRASEALSGIDTESEDADRRVASLVAIDAVADPETNERAGHAVERVLHPYVGGPFETVGGYADVLDAVAREAPGIAAALALGQDVREAALDAWRSHATRAHESVRTATTGRYDGLFVARDEGDVPVGTVARLLAEFRSPEPVVLALTDGRAAAVALPEAGVDLRGVFREAFDGPVAGTGREASAAIEVETADAIMAVREAMQA